MNAKSWNKYLEFIAYDKNNNSKRISVLYVVAVPQGENLEKDIDFKCYRPTYIPKEMVEKIGLAYAVATDFDINDFEKYSLLGYHPSLDAYIFKEGISYKDGYDIITSIVKDYLKSIGFEVDKIEVIEE